VGAHRSHYYIAAVSYGELSAMFPKRAGNTFISRKRSEAHRIFIGWSFFAVIQTGTIAAVGVAFSKFAAYLYEPFSDENILYEMGNFKLNAAQIVSIVTIIF
jgi:APA family basic amino acid/polyamine antiporter